MTGCFCLRSGCYWWGYQYNNKKGTQKPHETLDYSMGSWKRYHYGMFVTGSNTKGNVKYFLSARHEMGGDSHYRDGITGKNYVWHQTGYRDNTVNARFDFLLRNNQSIVMSYNHMSGNDDYPLTALRRSKESWI